MSESLSQQVVDVYHSLVDASLRQTPFDGKSKRAFNAWQKRARRIVKKALGEMPTEKVDFELRRETVEETESYLWERLFYTTRPGLQASAYLLTPKNTRLPAPGVLALHGHGREGKDGPVDPESIYHGFAWPFVEKGCVVLCPEQIGFNERAVPEGKVTYEVLVHGLNMLGHTLIGLRYWDLVRAFDLLQDMKTVDRSRIGVMGLSLGGEMTVFLSALQTRVKAACVAGYLTSHLNTFLDRPHCTCGHLRDLARHFEHVDLAALIAPRPLFLEAGREDPDFLYKDAQALVRDLRQVYNLHGLPRSHLGIHVHGGGHEIYSDKSVPWMVKRLNE